MRHKFALPDGAAPEKINVRVFLAAYMMVCFPTNVFERIGHLEQAALDAARRMLAVFEAMLVALHGHGRSSFAQLPPHLTAEFPAAVKEYVDRFSDWKVPDEARLIGRIERALLAVLQAQMQLGPATDAPGRAELAEQAGRLRQKLVQLSGESAAEHVEAAARASGVLVA